MFTNEVVMMIVRGIGESLYMTGFATLFGYMLGIPWGIGLSVTDKEGIRPNAGIYRMLDFVANIMRSVPFLIMLMLLIPVTRFVVGRSYGPTAAIVPLTISAAPFIARMVESSIKEVDHGVIEAAQSIGASDMQIVTKVLLPEARVSLVTGAVIALGTILGYSAMAGVVGAGGLGDIAVRYGYYRFNFPIMIVTVILLVLMQQIFTFIGMHIAGRIDKRHI